MRKMVKKFFIVTSAFLIFTIIALYVLLPNELFRFTAAEQSSRLPQMSLDYIEENFPTATVLDVDIELTGFEVYLSNGVSIEFKFSGTARYIDFSND